MTNSSQYCHMQIINSIFASNKYKTKEFGHETKNGTHTMPMYLICFRVIPEIQGLVLLTGTNRGASVLS
jgi:hypothetical protein